MNENAKKWVEALRGGRYKQGQAYLCADGYYCCLGVACEVARENGLLLNIFDDEFGVRSYDSHETRLSSEVCAWLGLRSEIGEFAAPSGSVYCSLAALNDYAEWSFSQIADFIESNPPGLFIEEKQQDGK